MILLQAPSETQQSNGTYTASTNAITLQNDYARSEHRHREPDTRVIIGCHRTKNNRDESRIIFFDAYRHLSTSRGVVCVENATLAKSQGAHPTENDERGTHAERRPAACRGDDDRRRGDHERPPHYTESTAHCLERKAAEQPRALMSKRPLEELESVAAANDDHGEIRG